MWLLLPVFLVPAMISYMVELQGFNLLDDGIWVLGTRVISGGGLLYRDFFSVYGPLKYYALLPFFWALGESVHSLVVFKALLAGCSSLLGFVVARRYGARHLAWLMPLGVVALGSIPPRYIYAAAFAILHAEMLLGGGSRFSKGIFLGLAWGCLALFGLDLLVYGAIIIVAGDIFTRFLGSQTPPLLARRTVGILAGFAGIAALSLLVSISTGILNTALWDTVVCPLVYSPHHLSLNFADGFLRPQGLDTVFSQVFTGEHLAPAWPHHVLMRSAGIRMMTALIFAAPFLAISVPRKAVDSRIGSLFALAVAGWVIFLWRSDVAHVFAAFYGTLLLLVCCLGAFRLPRVPVTLGVFLLLIAVMAPFAGERLWLMIHVNRASLVQWDRTTAGIKMVRSRHDIIERILQPLNMIDESPTIGWPAQPGLVFLSGKPLATPQVTLLAGSIRNESAIIDDLRESNPDLLLLGRVSGLAPGARSMESLAPATWTYLRSHFFIEGQFTDGAEGFQIIRSARKAELDIESLPLERRLPGTSQLVKNSQTPILKPGVTIGQVFRVGGLDLRGVVLLVATKGDLPAQIDMEMEIDELMVDGRTQSLALFSTHVPLDQRIQLRTLAFPVVPHTAGKMIVLNLSVTSDTKHEVRLLWHDPRADKGAPVDYYPDGHVVMNGRPIDADLFFISF